MSVLPSQTAGINEPTTSNRRSEEIDEIPSRMFSLLPLNITPRVPMSGMSRAKSNLYSIPDDSLTNL
ncbi:MAG: hypothetical protein ACD_75C00624G0002 [uncultured bacterium]|nr:MAG: hypothetical protein ACD_75C00624G0002 [uncultured bacterium]